MKYYFCKFPNEKIKDVFDDSSFQSVVHKTKSSAVKAVKKYVKWLKEYYPEEPTKYKIYEMTIKEVVND